jgi:hypothetical protein
MIRRLLLTLACAAIAVVVPAGAASAVSHGFTPLSGFDWTNGLNTDDADEDEDGDETDSDTDDADDTGTGFGTGLGTDVAVNANTPNVNANA